MLFFFVVSASATAVCNGIVAREGQNVTLGCNGFGLPVPSISWFNESNVVMENGRIWSLYDINRNMAGQYTCTASNSCGHDSQKIDVVVQCELQCNISFKFFDTQAICNTVCVDEQMKVCMCLLSGVS